ncbi:MAG: mechanosensitive ion channel domain-containing protein [Betaproteobacteria bacterium]
MNRYVRDLARAAFAALVVFTVAVSGAAFAADDGSARRVASDAAAAKPETVKIGRTPSLRSEDTVVIFNRPIVTFRAPFLGISPEDRAKAAHQRVVEVLERGGPGAVSVESLEPGDAVKVDGMLAFMLTRDDADKLSGETFAETVRNAVRALERTIGETQEARDGRRMLMAALWAMGATLVYVLLLWVLRRVGHAVTGRMLEVADSTAGQLKIGGSAFVQRERAQRFVRRLLQLGFWVFVLLLTYEWFGYVLSRFPYTRPWGEHLNSFLVNAIVDVLTSVAGAMPDLLIAIAIFFVARGITGMLKGFFDGVQAGRVRVAWLDADSARPTRRLAAIAVWIFALVMAYPYIPGSGTEAFKGLSVLVGLMVSIGASGIVGQAASGLILMFTRTFRPGEYVRVADHEGTIVELGMFTSRLRTGLGEELTLPNALVLGSVTRNYSRVVKGHGFVLDTVVTIGYDAPWRQVHAMLIEAARRTEGVLADPAPRVYQTALADFYVEYRLVCQAIQTDPRPRAEVLSNLHGNVQDVFNEHGVQIMSPHYLGDPTESKLVPKDKWYAAPAGPRPPK